MPVEIQNFHSALRKEMISIITVLGEFLSAKKRVSNSEDNVLKRVEHTETGSTDSVGDAALICEDFLTFLAVLTSHTDSEDALIFPVLVARIPDARARLAALDDQHSKINSTMHILKSQLKVFPDVHSEAARFCILEDIFTESTTFKSLMLSHLDLEEQILHPLMMDNMSVDEVNVIVGRVLGHRSSDMMEKILKLMYRHLSADDFAVCLDSIQKSVSGTFFEKWLSALPERVGDTRAESESVLSSIFEIGSIVSEGEQVFQNNTTVAGVMSGAIPDLLREQVLEILRKDYDDPVHYSLENVIRQENARLLSKSTKRKRKVNLADLTESKRVALRQSPTEIIPNDTHKSYFSVEDSILGCPHYRKKCKIVAPCCSKVYVCRLCHNEATDDGHTVDRYDIKSVVCMNCGLQQPVSNLCINPSCKTIFAKYFCKICNFYNDSDQPIYHCPYCNICRKGTGLGLDSEFFHCMKCNACVRNISGVVHKCLSHSIERTCPICQSYMFDSVDKLKGLSCGHVMHLSCFCEYRGNAHSTCPICRTSIDLDERPSELPSGPPLTTQRGI